MPRYEKIKRLEAAIGEKETLKVIWLFSGEHCHIPGKASLHRDLRNEMILRDYDRLITEGVKRPEKLVAARYGLTPNYVFVIIRKMRKGR